MSHIDYHSYVPRHVSVSQSMVYSQAHHAHHPVHTPYVHHPHVPHVAHKHFTDLELSY
jgi:hypothetical protein